MVTQDAEFDIQMLILVDAGWTGRILVKAINFLVIDWYHGIVTENWCAQVLWIKNRLRDYGLVSEKIHIICDNTSAISIIVNYVNQSKTKYIEVRYHFIREHAANGTNKLQFVPTAK